MNQGFRYREVLYKDYYNSQAGRTFNHQLMDKMKLEQIHLQLEILPLLSSDKNSRILDIGCGFGSLVYTLKQNGYSKVIGIDISEGQVKEAHALGLKDEVICCDLLTYLKEHKASFDVIIGLDIIEHFSKDELINLLELVKSSLVNGGMAIFRTPNMDAPFASIYANGDFTHENFLNASSAKQVCMSLGFTQAEVLPSLIRTEGFLKEIFRKLVWFKMRLFIRLMLFATARSYSQIVLTPNLLIRVVN